MMFCKENQYEIKFCIICGVNSNDWRGAGDVTIKPLLGLPEVCGERISKVELTCTKNYFIINNEMHCTHPVSAYLCVP